MRRMGRAMSLAALVLLVATVAVGFVPRRATAVEYTREPRVVNCGSFFIRSSWSGDAGCDEVRPTMIKWMGLLLLVAIPLGVVGSVLILAGRDQAARHYSTS